MVSSTIKAYKVRMIEPPIERNSPLESPVWSLLIAETMYTTYNVNRYIGVANPLP
nr:hypothetical protein Itr_chr12CG10490 [Ipomoea trifida]